MSEYINELPGIIRDFFLFILCDAKASTYLEHLDSWYQIGKYMYD